VTPSVLSLHPFVLRLDVTQTQTQTGPCHDPSPSRGRQSGHRRCLHSRRNFQSYFHSLFWRRSAPSVSLLEKAFKVYERIRLPLANSVLMKSRDNGRMYCLSYPGCRPEDLFEVDEGGRLRLGAEKVERMEKILGAQWSWAWTTTIEDDRDQAMRLLDVVLSSHMH
jgi:hypothetical protein